MDTIVFVHLRSLGGQRVPRGWKRQAPRKEGQATARWRFGWWRPVEWFPPHALRREEALIGWGQ